MHSQELPLAVTPAHFHLSGSHPKRHIFSLQGLLLCERLGNFVNITLQQVLHCFIICYSHIGLRVETRF